MCLFDSLVSSNKHPILNCNDLLITTNNKTIYKKILSFINSAITAQRKTKDIYLYNLTNYIIESCSDACFSLSQGLDDEALKVLNECQNNLKTLKIIESNDTQKINAFINTLTNKNETQSDCISEAMFDLIDQVEKYDKGFVKRFFNASKDKLKSPFLNKKINPKHTLPYYRKTIKNFLEGQKDFLKDILKTKPHHELEKHIKNFLKGEDSWKFQNYELSNETNKILKKQNINPIQFQHLYGNQIQQFIHGECVNIAEQASSLLNNLKQNGIFNQIPIHILNFTNLAIKYNKSGKISNAINIFYLCSNFLDFAKRIVSCSAHFAKGVSKGVRNVNNHIQAADRAELLKLSQNISENLKNFINKNIDVLSPYITNPQLATQKFKEQLIELKNIATQKYAELRKSPEDFFENAGIFITESAAMIAGLYYLIQFLSSAIEETNKNEEEIIDSIHDSKIDVEGEKSIDIGEKATITPFTIMLKNLIPKPETLN